MKKNPLKYSLPENDIRQISKEDINFLKTLTTYKLKKGKK